MTPLVPLHLLRVWNPAEAFAEPRDDWARAAHASGDATEAERQQVRTYGLVVRRRLRVRGVRRRSDGDA